LEALEGRALMASLQIVDPVIGVAAVRMDNDAPAPVIVSNVEGGGTAEVSAHRPADPVPGEEVKDYTNQAFLNFGQTSDLYVPGASPQDSYAFVADAAWSGGKGIYRLEGPPEPEPTAYSSSAGTGPSGDGTPVTFQVMPTGDDHAGDKVKIRIDTYLFSGTNYPGKVTATYVIGKQSGSLLSSRDLVIDSAVGQTFQVGIGVSSSGIWELDQGAAGAHLILAMGLLSSDIAMDDVDFDGTGSGIAFDYHTTGDPGPFTVGLYYSPTEQFDPSTAVPVIDPSTGQPASQTVTPTSPDAPKTKGVFTFPSAPANPAGLPYLLAVADPPDATHPNGLIRESDEKNNAASLALPDIAVQPIVWRPSTEAEWKGDPTNAGGVDVTYTISGSDLPQAAPIELYWTYAAGDILSNPVTTTDVNGNTLMTETAVNPTGQSYHVIVPASLLGTPQPGATALKVVIDPMDSTHPGGLITESSEDNNSQTLDASPNAILNSSVHYTVSGADITADFLPAEGDNPPPPDQPGHGALTIDQAKALLGISSFNWIQTITLPAGWHAYIINLKPGDYRPADPKKGFYYAEATDTTKALDDPTKSFPSEPLGRIGIPDPLLQFPGAYQTDETLSFLIVFNAVGQFSIAPLPTTDPTGTTFKPPDSLEYYYNLGADVGAPRITKKYEVEFSDGPTLGRNLGIGLAGQFMHYTTELAGVNKDNSPTTWTGLGTNFSWDTNAVSVSNVSFFRADNPAIVPPAVSGGVTDVVTDLNQPNHPPVLASIGAQRVDQGGTVSVTASATDPDQGQVLTYSLEPGAPPGATIDPRSGILTWAVPASKPPGDYLVTVRVTDNGLPPQSNSTSFTISVASTQQPTTLSAVSGSGTFGATATLSATLTAGGSPLAGKTVAFTLNNGGPVTTLGTATTDANGVATLTGVSLASITAGAYHGAVGASFAQDASDAASNATGNLTVSKATPSLSWANPAGIVYGTPLGASQLDATASVPGTIAYAPFAGTILHAARRQALTATFTPTDTADFDTATTTVLIDVAPALLTITADDKTMVVGTALPALTASYSGFVNRDGPANLARPVTLTTAATPGSPAGTYAISASAAASPDYTITFRRGTLTVTPTTTPPVSITIPRAVFVTTLYNDILGRNPEPAGLRYWVRRLAVGSSALNVARDIWTSPEHRGLLRSGVAPRSGFRLAFADALRHVREGHMPEAHPSVSRRGPTKGRSASAVTLDQ
jgi:hypothetical protein